jgi:hypothetical protein
MSMPKEYSKNGMDYAGDYSMVWELEFIAAEHKVQGLLAPRQKFYAMTSGEDLAIRALHFTYPEARVTEVMRVSRGNSTRRH